MLLTGYFYPGIFLAVSNNKTAAMISQPTTLWIAFAKNRRIARGEPRDVASVVKGFVDAHPEQPVAVFDAASSQPVNLDLRGSVGGGAEAPAACSDGTSSTKRPAARRNTAWTRSAEAWRGGAGSDPAAAPLGLAGDAARWCLGGAAQACRSSSARTCCIRPATRGGRIGVSLHARDGRQRGGL